MEWWLFQPAVLPRRMPWQSCEACFVRHDLNRANGDRRACAMAGDMHACHGACTPCCGQHLASKHAPVLLPPPLPTTHYHPHTSLPPLRSHPACMHPVPASPVQTPSVLLPGCLHLHHARRQRCQRAVLPLPREPRPRSRGVGLQQCRERRCRRSEQVPMHRSPVGACTPSCRAWRYHAEHTRHPKLFRSTRMPRRMQRSWAGLRWGAYHRQAPRPMPSQLPPTAKQCDEVKMVTGIALKRLRGVYSMQEVLHRMQHERRS